VLVEPKRSETRQAKLDPGAAWLHFQVARESVEIVRDPYVFPIQPDPGLLRPDIRVDESALRSRGFVMTGVGGCRTGTTDRRMMCTRAAGRRPPRRAGGQARPSDAKGRAMKLWSAMSRASETPLSIAVCNPGATDSGERAWTFVHVPAFGAFTAQSCSPLGTHVLSADEA